MVKNINTAGDSSPHDLTNVGGTLFFAATSGGTDKLWKSDGTKAGTVPVIPDEINPSFLTNFNGTLFFSANDGISGTELWKSNGTPGGTMMVKDINTVPGNSSNPSSLAVLNGTLFFSATDGTAGGDHGQELWQSDGSPDGTTMVADINPGTAGSNPFSLTSVDGTLYFDASDGTSGVEPWRSNGGPLVPGSTERVDDINPGPGSSFPALDGQGAYVGLNGTVFFRADDGTNGAELWKTTGGLGTPGAQLVADINPTGDSFPGELTAFNGALYFRALENVHGFELWKTNGGPLGPGGTELAADINPGAGSSIPQGFTKWNGKLFFNATGATTGSELWSSGGDQATTSLVSDVNPGAGNFSPQNITAVGNNLFFWGDDGTNGNELWKATVEGPAPTPAPAPTTAPAASTPTGLRAAALKKCKKKHGAKRKRCRKKARLLPV
jgi:ELWxxDGT repeat protein